ncbi:PhnD/SsuA/transferrin family substrate-binding protein [Companilactobacillus sp.]|uniref:phosphate/phosphite/phosphonate ABC transporter substrate-binding protein n=1 Tax=Companilactobacillus sp. TaxID=2767905 RepID=UPI0026051E98|nr:PhnD/SsuA/transferrin family substrate-binding protein [Companilactobacillus sp.]
MSNSKIKLGAVLYSPQVTVVWGIIAKYFESQGIDLDTVFYKDYRKQVKDLVDGNIDVAWNSPLAYVEAKIRSNDTCGYSYMRDTDRDRKSTFLVKKDSGIKSVEDLRGKTIGFGAIDSPQARLIPMEYLHENGLEPGKDYVEKTFDVDVGLDGDHEGGEVDALKALKAGDVDVSVTTEINRKNWTMDGTIDENQIVVAALTGLYDHCIFSTRPDFPDDLKEQFETALGNMDYNNPEHKEMMDLEGLKKWISGRTSGFQLLEKAVDYLDFFKE